MIDPKIFALNPQPIPPGRLTAGALNVFSSFSYGAINPQPLPPGGRVGIIFVGGFVR